MRRKLLAAVTALAALLAVAVFVERRTRPDLIDEYAD